MKWINKIITEDTMELFQDLYGFKNNKIKILLFFCLLPITSFFLLENFIVYFFSMLFYLLILICKIINYKIFKKNTNKIIFINRFKFLKKDQLIFIKNIFLEYPKSRAFFNFYNILKIIQNKSNNNIKESIRIIIKIIFNRYLILLITGLPYLLVFCNTWFTNKFYIIYKLKTKEKASLKDFLFVLMLNLNRDLMPMFKIYMKKMKIKFMKKKIIFNPKESFKKTILDLSEKVRLDKQIQNIKKDSLIGFVKNLEKIENNNKKWFDRHIETMILLNDEETISSNETSKLFLYNKLEKKEIENIYYGGCSYKNGDCYVTKPIRSKLEYKSFIKNSINHNIKNIDYEKVNYNQILAILFALEDGYIEAKYIKKNDGIEFYYKENKEDLMNLIRKNKKFMKNLAYESIENSNEFFKEVKKMEQEIGINKKIMLTHESLFYNLVKSNYDIYQLLKLK